MMGKLELFLVWALAVAKFYVTWSGLLSAVIVCQAAGDLWNVSAYWAVHASLFSLGRH